MLHRASVVEPNKRRKYYYPLARDSKQGSTVRAARISEEKVRGNYEYKCELLGGGMRHACRTDN